MNRRIKYYFKYIWEEETEEYPYSGPSILKQIKPSHQVIDVGCGYHPFKGKIINLIGIDPANDAADYVMSIEEYAEAFQQGSDTLFDVAFVFGSINFGDYDTFDTQIKSLNKIMNLHEAKIFWRCNPARADHGNEECKDIKFFPWSEEYMQEFADKYGYKIDIMTREKLTTVDKERIYAEWSRDYK